MGCLTCQEGSTLWILCHPKSGYEYQIHAEVTRNTSQTKHVQFALNISINFRQVETFTFAHGVAIIHLITKHKRLHIQVIKVIPCIFDDSYASSN